MYISNMIIYIYMCGSWGFRLNACSSVDQGVGLREGGWGVSFRRGRWVEGGKEEGVGNAIGNIGHVEDWSDAGHTAAFQPSVTLL